MFSTVIRHKRVDRSQRDSSMRFLAADMPEANDLTIGIMALVAEQERQTISRRTIEALAVAKARGVRLGNPNGAAALRRAGTGGVALQKAVSANADRFAADVAPVAADIRAAVHVSKSTRTGGVTAHGLTGDELVNRLSKFTA